MKKSLLLPLLMISFLSLAQNVKEIIGKPVKIGNLLVAENDFPREMNWDDAKKACIALGNGWRLPTKNELIILHKNREKIGGFTTNYYWSSTEFANGAWVQRISNGFQYGNGKITPSYSIRAVRTF